MVSLFDVRVGVSGDVIYHIVPRGRGKVPPQSLPTLP